MAGATTRRVVMFPFPFPSHIAPMLQLAELLRARGLAVTVVHTSFNAPDSAGHPELTFVPMHERLPDAATDPGADLVGQMLALNAACEAPFREALRAEVRRGQAGRSGGEVACAVVDGQWYAAITAAAEVGVAALALRTDSAATLHCMLSYSRLCSAGYLPIKGKCRDEVLPPVEPLRGRDLIRVDGSDAERVREFIARVDNAMRAAAMGVVFNTFHAIEAPVLHKIRRQLLTRATFAIGPMHRLLGAPEEHGLHAPDRGCVAWLHAQAPRSVLYVSLGSVARIDREVFDEMAMGLAGSGVPFLWVIRPAFVTGTADGDAPPLPEPLAPVVADGKGKVVTWAPQRDVLAHPAIGGFWTHCGWNSTLESICEGVPMLVQPCFGDQTVNARYVTQQWGVGLELGEVFDRARVAEAVRKLMVGEEGAAVRERARDLKAKARQSVEDDGASAAAIDRLVRYMVSF
ncbi:DIMBOA UDP-glucosyltransferase BX8-like [Oryza brachyantha]|uniref:DIMBOA UDP-glucosyltransferase BX8-like n=1 Tax=Oryza brachyantha TaxID=4533 RepID=UPI001ADBF80D|nr:DIMBOA UDP-glucosyltransferase BX8-like [Oryza brachyantha]